MSYILETNVHNKSISKEWNKIILMVKDLRLYKFKRII